MDAKEHPPAHAMAYRRHAWADDARGIGIVLVVLGHAISGSEAAGIAPGSPAANAVYAFIYGFHMPLFFFLSGVFVPRSIARRDFLRGKVDTLIYPYVVWTLIQGAMTLALAADVNTPTTVTAILVGLAVNPISHLWFLWVLFLLSALAHLAYRFRLSANAALAIAVGLWSVAMVPVLFGAIGLVPRSLCRYAIYFAIGLRVSKWILGPRSAHRMPLFAVAVLGIAGAWATREWPSNPALAPVTAGLGVSAVLAIAFMLGAGATWLTQLGRWTMPIYLGHVMAAAGMRIGLLRLGIRSQPAHLMLATICGVSAPALLGWARDRGHFVYLFSPDGLRFLRTKRAIEPKFAGHAETDRAR